jgi:DNA repair exonuclease SbcCD ATPase subunit
MNTIKLERDIHSSYVIKIKDVDVTIRGLHDEQAKFKVKGLDHKNKIEQANKSIEQLKAAEAQIEEKTLHLDFFTKEIAEIQGNLDVFLWLIDNIPFIKLHKMSVAMAEISDLANEYLEDLGDSMRISITSFEHKTRQKNAADVKALMKSDVKIEIVDGSKNISPKLYSDGETSKISVAIIRALNELARKYGQGCNLMLLDEIFSFVDTNNSQKIASSMSKLLKKGTVFVTDNSGSVKDLIDFDHTWVARKRLGQTELEV